MAKLNQIIAVANGKKSRAQRGLTEVYHKLQSRALFDGISRTYRPKDDDGDHLPAESSPVQFTVDDATKEVVVILTELFDVVATQDFANTQAVADVKVNGDTVLENVPVTHLLFLEKQLVDLHTFVDKLPTLSTAEEWVKGTGAGTMATKPSETVRTKKVPKNHVKAEATNVHPAQVEVFTEDVIVGHWTTIKHSGAIPESEKKRLVARVRLLQDALKTAREEANSMNVVDRQIGKQVFAFLFGDNR